MRNKKNLVFSTDHGKLCPSCGAPETQCECEPTAPPAGDGWVRISRNSKGRGGKTVSIVSGLGMTEAELKPLAKQLKQLCGVGGAVKSFDIEIQGDQREKLKAFLEGKGHKVKLAGS